MGDEATQCLWDSHSKSALPILRLRPNTGFGITHGHKKGALCRGISNFSRFGFCGFAVKWDQSFKNWLKQQKLEKKHKELSGFNKKSFLLQTLL
jgi:hypothetical protein